jgi:metal-dependent amidase/aminoacylase/carboxypeptidase family protein
LWLNDHPEIGYEEHKAHAKVAAYLKQQGFDVEEHYKLDTAFRASYTHGKGGRVFGLNSEYDALPGVGESERQSRSWTSGKQVLITVHRSCVRAQLDLCGGRGGSHWHESCDEEAWD